MVEGAVAAVVEVVVNKRRKKFKSRRDPRVRTRSSGSCGRLVGLFLFSLIVCGIFTASLTLALVLVVGMADLEGGVAFVVGACVSVGFICLGVKLMGKRMVKLAGGGGGGGGCSSGCSDGGGGGGGCGGGGE